MRVLRTAQRDTFVRPEQSQSRFCSHQTQQFKNYPQAPQAAAAAATGHLVRLDCQCGAVSRLSPGAQQCPAVPSSALSTGSLHCCCWKAGAGWDAAQAGRAVQCSHPRLGRSNTLEHRLTTTLIINIVREQPARDPTNCTALLLHCTAHSLKI